MENSPGERLAKALQEKGWQRSKSTDKLVTLMAGLADIPWEKVKAFKLEWEVLTMDDTDYLVPTCQLAMHEPVKPTFVSGLDSLKDPDFNVEPPKPNVPKPNGPIKR